jgi:23S rRNA pseudouridine1911/1915/1917 synthase
VAFDVVYADSAMVVVDKPAGLVVHPAPGHQTGTLVHGLLARFPELRDPTGEMRPGIVHRLDKDTSGLLVVGRTVEAVAALQREMQAGLVRKRYRLLVLGTIQEREGIIDVPIGRDRLNRQKMAARADGRPSRTEFQVLERLGTYTYLDAGLPSGRTHQLRVHFAYIGHPVAGDRTYGNGRGPAGLTRQFVHSYELTLRSPADGQERTFRSQLPADLACALAALRPSTQAVPAVTLGEVDDQA